MGRVIMWPLKVGNYILEGGLGTYQRKNDVLLPLKNQRQSKQVKFLQEIKLRETIAHFLSNSPPVV